METSTDENDFEIAALHAASAVRVTHLVISNGQAFVSLVLLSVVKHGTILQ